MSAVPPSGAPRPVSTQASGVAPEIPPASGGGASLAALWLQTEAYRQLADLTTQQAAAKMKAQMQASASAAPPSSIGGLILNHDQLAQLNKSVGGMSSLLAMAVLLSKSGQLPGGSGSQYNTELAELTALGKGLMDLLQGAEQCENLSTDNGDFFTAVRDKLVQALCALPSSQLAVILYSALYGGKTTVSRAEFESDLATLSLKDSPLGILAKKAVEAHPVPCPLNGSWTADSLNQLTTALSGWFKSPQEDPNGYWDASVAVGLQASLTPWIQALGRDGNAAANTDIGCLKTVAMALSVTAEVGGNTSLFTQIYQTGSGMLSLGLFINIEMASYYYQSIVAQGGSADALSAQMQKLIAQHATTNPNDPWNGELRAVDVVIGRMDDPDSGEKALTHPSDALAAPLMALVFGGVPKQLTQAEAIAEAVALFSPERIRSLASQISETGASTEVESQIREERLQETRYKETRG